jgi:hypothetical protein
MVILTRISSLFDIPFQSRKLRNIVKILEGGKNEKNNN